MSADPAATECKGSVLLVDDDALVLATLGRGLREAGLEVHTARDAAGAIAICSAQSISVAVIDYALPGASGPDLARTIAAQTSAPIIILSAYDDKALVREAIASGAMTYLVKPIDTRQLLPVLCTALKRSQELHALRAQTEQLSLALQSERTISVATGLVMAKFQIGRAEAFERIRQQARATRTRVEQIAAELLQANDAAGRLYEHLRRPPGGPTEA